MFEVFKKELTELLRDKKTLLFVVALPVAIFPIIFGTLGYFMVQAQIDADQEVHKYKIIGKKHAKEFSESIFYHKNFSLITPSHNNTREQLINEIKKEEIDLGIVINTETDDSSLSETINIEIIFNNSSRINYIYDKVNEIYQEFKHSKQLEKLTLNGIAAKDITNTLEPVKLIKTDTADLRENIGEKLGILLPYLLIPLVLTGASYPAIDLGAGEKERGTLETLLLTPITRTNIVLGKFFTIFFASMITSLVTVFSLGAWLFISKTFISVEMLTDAITLIDNFDLLLILLLLLPLSAIFSSIVLAISIYSKTFKEAQNYMGPLSMIVFVPLAISMMPNMDLNAETSLIPIVSTSLAIRELLKGTIDYSFVYIIFTSTLSIAILTLSFCVKWFKKEDVLFR